MVQCLALHLLLLLVVLLLLLSHIIARSLLIIAALHKLILLPQSLHSVELYTPPFDQRHCVSPSLPSSLCACCAGCSSSTQSRTI